MDGIGEAYCDAVIRATLSAYREIINTPVGDLLEPTKYGKSDTLGLDAIPEIAIKEALTRFDQQAILFTEELAPEQKAKLNPRAFSYPVIYISDPTDRSSFLKRFLQQVTSQEKQLAFKEILDQQKAVRNWDILASGPAIISGPTSAITIIRGQKAFFSVIVNYLTKHIFVACEKGSAVLELSVETPADIQAMSLARILKEGARIAFDFDREDWHYQDNQRHVTFLGKEVYGEAFGDINLPSQVGKHLVYDEPGGATRIFYLSNLCQEDRVGFVLANGEKVIEWIHWLPWIAVSRGSNYPLRIFEIAPERPRVKGGVLMATSPTYSIFKEHNHSCFIDIPQLLKHKNPSLCRSTLLVTHEDNLWAIRNMKGFEYRELHPSF